MTGSSTQGIKTVLHPVSDLAAATAVYTALLGVPPRALEVARQVEVLGELEARTRELAPDRRIVAICRSGARSAESSPGFASGWYCLARRRYCFLISS